MRHFLIVLICLVLLPTSILAADTVYGVNSTQERVITLPQDQGQWYISIFGDLNDDKFQDLQKWFQTHKGLSKLRKQTHYNVYMSHDVRYQRYAKTIPGLPCIRVQNSKGQVISEFWNDYIPMSDAALYKGICNDIREGTKAQGLRSILKKCCPKNRRNPPVPEPEPEPTPELVIDKPPVIDDEPKPEESFPWLALLAAIVVGAGFGVGKGFKSEHIDVKAPISRRP